MKNTQINPDRRCFHCGAQTERARNKYCSHRCSGAGQMNKIEITCGACGQVKMRHPSMVRGKVSFCSNKCKLAHQKAANHPRWNGGKTIDSQGYLALRVGKQKYKYEHRLIMEEIYGRALRADEHVHHINGNKLDNTWTNLCILTPKVHRIIHKLQEMDGRWSQKHDKCIECGRTDRKHHGRGYCRICTQRKLRYEKNQVR